MQSTDDLPKKVSKPKPNNKTKTWAKKRPGEDFKSKSRSSSLNRENNSSNKNAQLSDKVTETKAINNIENKNICENKHKETKQINNQNSTPKICEPVKNVFSNMNSENKTSTMNSTKSREEILAAREAKKNAKKGCKKNDSNAAMVIKNQEVICKEAKNTDSIKNQVLPSASSIKSEKLESELDNKQIHVSKNEDQTLIEKQLKKLPKQMQSMSIKPQIDTNQISENKVNKKLEVVKTSNENISKEKTREEIMAEREAKKMAKQAAKSKNKEKIPDETAEKTVSKPAESTNIEKTTEIPEKKPTLSKAERRAIQEAQRSAKAKLLEEKQKVLPQKSSAETTQKDLSTPHPKKETSPNKGDSKISPSKISKSVGEYKVKLFKHLDREHLQEKNQFINNPLIHPAIVQLGEQVATRTIVGSNARCIAFLKALKNLIEDYQTPAKKEFARSLEESINNCVQYLHKCRPLAVSVSNAHKAIQSALRHLKNDLSESESKKRLCEHIDSYIEDQIEKAAKAISGFVQEKISDGDVILTFGCSSLIYQILEEAHESKKDFRVVVVDSRPFCEGQELLRKLCLKEIPCTYVLINAVGFIMPEVTKIIMGAHALLANGNVMARIGTAQVALVAKSFNVPVLVCCETYKFSERVQTDAIVYNELGNPDDLVMNKSCKLANWQKGANKILPLNLNYDITPPELVTAVVTEVAILPCTSVPVILRIKPTDVSY